jgi:uncharacterized protein YegL
LAANDFFEAESPENYEQKCLCVLALDVSGSMSNPMGGMKPIDELNDGLEDFYFDIQEDATTANRLEVAIVTFHSEVQTELEPSLVENFEMPELVPKGSTKMVDGVREAIEKVEARKKWYKDTGQPYYRPWVILITDGEPDSDQDVKGLAKEIHDATKAKKFAFLAVGVEGANMKILREVSNPDMPPQQLQGLKFSAFFKWLSASMSTVTSSDSGQQVNLPKADDWTQGFTT